MRDYCFGVLNHPRVVVITGQGGRQPNGGGRQRNRSPASLGVGQLQLTRIEINGDSYRLNQSRSGPFLAVDMSRHDPQKRGQTGFASASREL